MGGLLVTGLVPLALAVPGFVGRFAAAPPTVEPGAARDEGEAFRPTAHPVRLDEVRAQLPGEIPAFSPARRAEQREARRRHVEE